MTKKACSFTGHRVIPRAHRDALIRLVDRGIAYAYGEGCTEFITGGALGFDTLVAERVIAYRRMHPDIRLLLLLPCEDQTEGWRRVDIAIYENILRYADEIIYLDKFYTPDCMKRRNQMLVDRADMMIGYVGHQRSGAAQTERMARLAGVPFYNLYHEVEKTD